jgi:hypothetical protein
MRAFFALVDAGQVVVPAIDLAARLAPEELAALRSAGIVRPLAASSAVLGAGAVEEISLADLARAVRDLYDVDPRGLPTPSSLSTLPVTIGWIGSGSDEREVVIVGRRGAGLMAAFAMRRKTLVLLPIADGLTDAQRTKHGAGAFSAVEVLAEALFARDGHLVRAPSPSVAAIPVVDSLSNPTPWPTAYAVTSRAPTATPTPPPSPNGVSRISGASRWNEVAISVVDPQTVRIDLPAGRSHRRTHVDLGMAHAQNREPTRVWDLLVAFCEGHGSLQTSRFGSVEGTKKLVSRLRVVLREAFGLGEDPFHPYRRGDGWRTRFVASPHARDARR